ncbi:MAG: branched-chain amino acid ABC transporter permease [Bacillales bacterium]|jgi:branched-chain amino acid transport system permease protein|nr:branched-chain amino acid ABC transporter permease [Bacillales bacterium]
MNKLLKNVKDFMKKPYLAFIVVGLLLTYARVLNSQGVINVTLFGAIYKTAYYFVAGLGFALLLGYGGLASLGTAGFIAVGSFGFHYLYTQSGMFLSMAIVVVMVLAIVVGIVFGFVSLRISGMYLAIITMGLSQILIEVIKNIPVYMSGSTGGFGRNGIALFGDLANKLDRNDAMYIVAIIVTLAMFLIYNLMNSPTGRALLAMKNSETAAQTMGINLVNYRLLAFVLSGILGSLAGVLKILNTRGDSVSEMTLALSLNILASVVVGGMGSIWGIMLGTFVIFGLDLAVFKQIPALSDGILSSLPLIINGVLIIIVVMFYPGGLIRLFTDVRIWIKKIVYKRREKKYGKD